MLSVLHGVNSPEHIYHYISLYITIDHYISLYIIIYHYTSLYIIIYHYIWIYIIMYHYISLYIIIYHYISLYIIIYHYTSLYIIIHHYISWYMIIYIYHLFVWWEDSLPNLGSFLGRRELRRWVSCPPHHEPRPAGSATRCGTHGSKLKYPTGSHRIP